MPAKKGNKNAYKHGIYSTFIAAQDDEEMVAMATDKNFDEIAYARVRLAAAQRERNGASDDEAKLKWDFACRHWAEILINAINNNRQEQPAPVIYDHILDYIRAANDRQGVKK